MLASQYMKKLLISTGVALCILGGSNAFAKAQLCSDSDRVSYSGDELHVITSIEPELLQPSSISNNSQSKEAESSSWYSWLTESHTMPSLHFIQLLELFETS